MSETVLVTGGSGYLAGWCIVALLERGHRVRASLRNLSKADTLHARIASETDPGDRLDFVRADLTADAGWDAALAGCESVLHVASPLGSDNPSDPDELIVPARDGTLRVLRAAAKAGVRRIVMTSSCAAAMPPAREPDGLSDESVWTDPEAPSLTAYRKSKAIAEKAAWDFMVKEGGAKRLTTILPGAVLGPVLSTENLGSVQLISRMLAGSMPGLPHLAYSVVDVRDLAELHVRALSMPQAEGERFLATGQLLSLSEIAQILRERMGAEAAKVPTRTLPDILVRLASLFDPGLRSVTPDLGRRQRHDPTKAERLLGWRTRPAADTVVDCARSLIARGGTA